MSRSVAMYFGQGSVVTPQAKSFIEGAIVQATFHVHDC